MALWKSILIIAGISLISEYFYFFIKKRMFSIKDENKLITFEYPYNSCNKSKKCTNQFCSYHNLDALVKYIDSARVCMDICVFLLTCEQLTRAIKRASRRGVVIRIIVNFSESGTQNFLGEFYQEGIPIRWKKSDMLMHHKICIIDCPQRVANLQNSQKDDQSVVPVLTNGLLMSGSMNWTKQAVTGNWESVYITNDSVLVKEFFKNFEKMWKEFDPDNLKT